MPTWRGRGGRGARGDASPFKAQRATSGSGSTGQSGRGTQSTSRLRSRLARGSTCTPMVAEPQTAAGQAAECPGRRVAAFSPSRARALRPRSGLYNGKNKYNEWIFMAVRPRRRPVVPPGSGGQTPGGRGGTAGGRGGTGPGRWRGTAAPPPGGTRGRSGVLADRYGRWTDLVLPEFFHHRVVQRRTHLLDRVVVWTSDERGWSAARRRLADSGSIHSDVPVNPTCPNATRRQARPARRRWKHRVPAKRARTAWDISASRDERAKRLVSERRLPAFKNLQQMARAFAD